MLSPEMEIYKETFEFDRIIYNNPLDIPEVIVPPKKHANWEDHFEKGLESLKENNTVEAEQSISRALKILCMLQNASHRNKEKSKCFHVMAEIYSAKALPHLNDLDSFCEMLVKSIALYEAERIYKYGFYKEDKEIDHNIKEVQIKLIDTVFGSHSAERFEKSNNQNEIFRQKLKEIRSRITNEYFLSLSSLPDWSLEEELQRCHEIEQIYNKIHDDMTNFLVEVFHNCCEIACLPTCDFSIIGLGSMSRKEVTPYSDIEFAILINENSTTAQRQYFRFLTYMIQAEIIKLGETILPSVGISSLNDFYSMNKKDDWFYDNVIPKGVSFDGMMPWACKTPLGRKEWRGEPKQEYIMTIDEMVELQKVTPDSSLESLKTANVFRSVCHLYGENNITKAYVEKLSSFLTNGERIKSFQEQVLKIMKNLVVEYDLSTVHLKQSGSQQDVKKEVYRLTSLLVEQLSNFFGIFGQSSWQCIREMSNRKLITEDGAKNLLVALSITTELRLRCYHKHGRQKEALQTVPQLSLSGTENTSSVVSSAIIRLYQSLIPLNIIVDQIVGEMSRHSMDLQNLVLSVLRQVSFFDDSPKLIAMACLRILQLPRAFDCLQSIKNDEIDNDQATKVKLALTYCYQLVGKFDEAIKCCKDVQKYYIATPDVVSEDDLLTAMHFIMNVYVEQGLYQEAVKMYDQILDIENVQMLANISERKLDFLNSSAVLFIKLQQLKKAEQILRDVMQQLSNQRKYRVDYFLCLNNLAVTLLSQDKLTDAKSVLYDALEVANELYGANAIHPYFCRCLTNLAEVYYFLRKLEDADRFVELALNMYSHVYENELLEPSIVDALVIKARIHQFHKNWDEMFNCLNKAKEIVKFMYERQPHRNVSNVLLLIGRCEEERGHFSEALSYYQEYLKILESRQKESQNSREDCRNSSVLVRISNVAAFCSCELSYRQLCLEKALEIEEKIHGKDSHHGHLAICIASLGYLLIGNNRAPEGINYLEKAMQIFEKNNLDQSRTYGFAQLNIAALLCQHSPIEAEKRLKTAEGVLSKTLNDKYHGRILQINTILLKIYQETERTQDGFELAQRQRGMIDFILTEGRSPTFQQLVQMFYLGEFYEYNGRRNTAKDIYFQLVRFLEEKVEPNSVNENLRFLLWLTQHKIGEFFMADEMFNEAEAMFQRTASSIQRMPSKRKLVTYTYQANLCHQASVFMNLRRYPLAQEKLGVLINIYENEPENIDNNIAASAFFTRGELNRRCSSFKLALADLEKALKIADGHKINIGYNYNLKRSANILYAKIMNAIGLVYEQTSNPARALENYRSCLRITEDMPLIIATATFHQNTADALKKLGQIDEALLYYKKSLKIREKLHSDNPVREDIATVLYHIALIQFTKRAPKEASLTLDKLLTLRKKLLKDGCSLQNYCAALILKGNCHIVQPDEAQKAKEAYEEAEKVLQRITGGKLNVDYAVTISNIGYACTLLKEWDQAISWLKKALELKKIFYGKNPSYEVANALRLLSTAYLEHNEYKNALQHFQECLQILQVINSPDDEVECILNIANCHKGLNNDVAALNALCGVEEFCAKNSFSDEMRLYVQNELSDLYCEKYTNKSKALYHLKEAEAILKRQKNEDDLSEIQAKIFSLEF